MRYLMVIWSTLLLVACGPPPVDRTVLTEAEREQALERGAGIAQATFGALSKRLQDAMASGGPAHAVDVCWVAALPITDSLAEHHGVTIKRTSDRLRAPHDAPDAHETQRLAAALDLLDNGVRPVDLPAEVFLLGDTVAYYAPILIAGPLCLSCHGTPDAGLDSAAHAVIRARYPEDAATGYTEVGQFRGLWSIRWSR